MPTPKSSAPSAATPVVADTTPAPVVDNELEQMIAGELGISIPKVKPAKPAKGAASAAPAAGADDDETDDDDATPADDAAAATDAEAATDEELEEAEEVAETPAEIAARELQEALADESLSPALKAHLAATEARAAKLAVDLAKATAAKPTDAPPAATAAAAPAGSYEEQVAGADSLAGLEAVRARMEQLEDLALSYPDGMPMSDGKGGVLKDAEGNERLYTPEQMRAVLLGARRALRTVPTRAAFLGERVREDKAAATAYPDYAKEDSPLSVGYAEFVRQHPALARSRADLKTWFADAERGKRLRIKAAAQPGAGLPGRAIVRADAAPSATARRVPAAAPLKSTDKATKLAALAAKAESGNPEDMEAYLEAARG